MTVQDAYDGLLIACRYAVGGRESAVVWAASQLVHAPNGAHLRETYARVLGVMCVRSLRSAAREKHVRLRAGHMQDVRVLGFAAAVLRAVDEGAR